MIKELYNLYVGRWHFFLNLTLQHIEISVISIVLATIIGLGLGIFISQYKRSSSTVLGITNFIYTIPSIALFGFLIPFSGIGNTTAIVALTVYAYSPWYVIPTRESRGSTKRSRKLPKEWEALPFKSYTR